DCRNRPAHVENRARGSSRGQREVDIMRDKSLTISFTVDQPPEQVFAAINDVRGWWSGEIDGKTDQPGAQFEYRYKDFHRSVQKITEWVPGKKVVWHVVDSQLTSFEDANEWKGTDIVFDIARKGSKTEVRFTHVGLVPTFQCYGD